MNNLNHMELDKILDEYRKLREHPDFSNRDKMKCIIHKFENLLLFLKKDLDGIETHLNQNEKITFEKLKLFGIYPAILEEINTYGAWFNIKNSSIQARMDTGQIVKYLNCPNNTMNIGEEFPVIITSKDMDHQKKSTVNCVIQRYDGQEKILDFYAKYNEALTPETLQEGERYKGIVNNRKDEHDGYHHIRISLTREISGKIKAKGDYKVGDIIDIKYIRKYENSIFHVFHI